MTTNYLNNYATWSISGNEIYIELQLVTLYSKEIFFSHSTSDTLYLDFVCNLIHFIKKEKRRWLCGYTVANNPTNIQKMVAIPVLQQSVCIQTWILTITPASCWQQERKIDGNDQENPMLVCYPTHRLLITVHLKY